MQNSVVKCGNNWSKNGPLGPANSISKVCEFFRLFTSGGEDAPCKNVEQNEGALESDSQVGASLEAPRRIFY
jgi:hypothetical protein